MNTLPQRLTIRRAWVTVVVTMILTGAAGVAAAGVFGRLAGGGFDDPSSESSRARTLMSRDLGLPEGNLVLLVEPQTPGSTVDDPAVTSAGKALSTRLAAEPGVQVLASYWNALPALAAGLASTDHRAALVVAHTEGRDDVVRARTEHLQKAFTSTTGVVRVRTGGDAQADLDVNTQVKADLAAAEAIAIPVTLLLLVVVFGSVVAGILPLLIGGMAMVITAAVLAAVAVHTEVSVFSLNLVSALGLGLGIDYSLLMVSRFREELAAGLPVPEAVAATVSTAGRTVMYSAATIVIALSAMLAFPLYFLRSMAYAGVVVVAVAALGSLVLLPAVLRLLGTRVNGLRVGPRRDLGNTHGWWYRWANLVMRRPLVTGLPVVALISVLALPVFGVRFGLPDDQVVQASSSQARAVGDVLRSRFSADTATGLHVVLPSLPGTDPAVRSRAAGDFARQVSHLPDVVRVDSAAGIFAHGEQTGPPRTDLLKGPIALIQILPAQGAYSSRAQDLVERVRTESARAGVGPVLVGGQAAALIDVRSVLANRLPIAVAITALGAFVILFLFTGSIFIPLKALLVNAFGILGVLGLMVWIFQDGHFSGILGFTPLPLSITMPMLMFCVAFGLSMDYEVFLIGRIKEHYDAGRDTGEAVVAGLERTGRIVTAAGVLLAITFFAFVSSKVSFIQMLGLGTGLAIVLDATLIRAILVPALMTIARRWIWWAPRSLRLLHQRYGLREGSSEVRPAAPDTPPAVLATGADGR
jgi:RND superfamily putative drug exporter